MPIAEGLPGPALLAHLILSKGVDHLPLHRLEHVYQWQGLFLHRSTLCDWMGIRSRAEGGKRTAGDRASNAPGSGLCRRMDESTGRRGGFQVTNAGTNFK